MDFPTRLKAVRTQLGLSQEAIARELNVSFATINRWEKGRTSPYDLAIEKFEGFCKRKSKAGKLNLKEIDG